MVIYPATVFHVFLSVHGWAGLVSAFCVRRIRMKGLDISKWNKGISMPAIKQAGYSFVIIRGGYTRYGDRSLVKDPCFDKFYQQAKKTGLSIGAYWYSCANSKKTGKAEAEFFYTNCLKGKKFDYPVYIDTENPQWQSGNKKGTTEAVVAFCEYLEGKGYHVGVYASKSWFTDNMDLEKIKKYTKWVACWGKVKPDVNYKYDMWQYTDSATVGGKKVDANICYVDFPNITRKKSNTDLAYEVINGRWGNGSERKRRLTQAGYDCYSIQKIVNKILAR